MAVAKKIKNNRTTIGDFRRFYKKNITLLIILSQLVLVIGLGGILQMTSTLKISDLFFWIILLSTFAFGTAVLFIMMSAITMPFLDVLSVLSHKIGEPSTKTLPNPNSKDNKQTGFKAVLEAIYSASVEDSKLPTYEPKESNDLLTNALNQTSTGIIILGPDKKIISANKAAPVAQSQDGSSYIALDFIDDTDIMAWLEECDNGAISAERRWKRVATDPETIRKQKFFDVVASYEKDAPAETVIILTDQSEMYLPEEEDLNFIAFAAHELRGPITVIRGYLDILEDEMAGRLKGDEGELLARLTVSANRLSGYINNILNVARFDRHHLKVHLSEDTILNIYSTIADDMQMRAQTQHRLLNIDIPEDLPTVAADRSSISEVIANLVDNAIKYSFEGGVVTVSAQAKGDFVEVSVSDNGVGIPASVIKNLFRKFYRSHRSREAVAGTGIGLYICRAFVESHGGNIGVTSQENEGSTFTFTLPIYATVANKLLEDNQLNQGLIRQGSGWIKNHSMYRR